MVVSVEVNCGLYLNGLFSNSIRLEFTFPLELVNSDLFSTPKIINLTIVRAPFKLQRENEFISVNEASYLKKFCRKSQNSEKRNLN